MNDTTSINNHRKIQQNLIHNLETLQKISTEFYGPENNDTTAILDIKKRLEDDVFNIAIVGEFKRGKSTLINALLGKEILPADVLPCSATLNRVTYGLQPKVELRFKQKPDEDVPKIKSIPIEELSDYVTKLTPESEEKASEIEEAVVYYPTTYCRDKADIIDTPGLNDDASMTEVTLKVLPEVDACILVILAQSPFSAYEADFLSQMLTHDLGKVLFVVNRIDEIRRPKDRKRIVDLVRTRIKTAIETRIVEIHGKDSEAYHQTLQKIGEPQIYAVSGGLALDGKLEDDPELIEESGFPHFEAALEKFLTIERGMISLTIANNLLITKATHICREISIIVGSLHLKREHFQSLLRETKTKLNTLVTKLNELVARYEDSRAQLLQDIEPIINASDQKMLHNIEKVIDDCELTASEITDDKEEALQRIQKAIKHQFQINYEKVLYEVHEKIQIALGKDLEDFHQINAEAQKTFYEIQSSFTEDTSFGQEIMVSTLAIASRYNPLTVFASGAISGYKMAGLKGAAIGGLSGAAAGLGTFVLGAIALSSTTLTFPLAFGILTVSGVSSWFGGKWTTSYFLGENIVQEFKNDCKMNVITPLKESMPEYLENMRTNINNHVNSGYEELITSVNSNLGNSIQQTRKSLESLHNKRLTEGTEREKMIEKYSNTVERLQEILEYSKRIQETLQDISKANE